MCWLLGFRKESPPRASTSPRQGRSKRGGVVQTVLWAEITLPAVGHIHLKCVADIKVPCCSGSFVELVSAGLCLDFRTKPCRGTPKRCCRSTLLQSSRHPNTDSGNVETSSWIQFFTSGRSSDCPDTRGRRLLRPDWLAYALWLVQLQQSVGHHILTPSLIHRCHVHHCVCADWLDHSTPIGANPAELLRTQHQCHHFYRIYPNPGRERCSVGNCIRSMEVLRK